MAGDSVASRVGPILIVSMIALAGAGCDSVLDDTQELPDFARVVLTGTSPVDLEIVTSTNYQVVSDFELQETFIQLILSDTVLAVPPYEDDIDIRSSERFFVRVTNHALEVADVTLEVSFDGRVEYSQAAFMSEGGSLEFSQTFSGT